MSDRKTKLLSQVEIERLVAIIKRATNQHTKVLVALYNGAALAQFDLLDIAKELANRVSKVEHLRDAIAKAEQEVQP